jgi:hypothetical protein
MSNRFDDLFEIETQPKRKNSEDKYTWRDVLKAQSIFLGSMALFHSVFYVFYTLFFSELSPAFNEVLNAASTGAKVQAITMYDNPAWMLFQMTIGLVIYVLGSLFLFGIIHLIATRLMNGIGSYRGIITQTAWWNTGVAIAYGLLAGIYNLYAINRFIKFYSDNANSLSEPQFAQAFMQMQLPLLVLTVICWLVWLVGIGRVTSRNYELSVARGVITVVLTNAILFALFCGLWRLLLAP